MLFIVFKLKKLSRHAQTEEKLQMDQIHHRHIYGTGQPIQLVEYILIILSITIMTS